MIWNPPNAYMRIRDEIGKHGLIESKSNRNKLNLGDTLSPDRHGITTTYTVVHMPATPKKSGDVIVFGIEYANRMRGAASSSPQIPLQYESGDGNVLLRVLFDLYNDRVEEVKIDNDVGDQLASLQSIKGMSLEDGVKVLFETIYLSRLQQPQ